MHDVKHILVMSRSTTDCKKAVHYGIFLARTLGARLSVLHVLYDPFGLKGLPFVINLGELEEEYRGKAAILFIDVWKNRDQGPKFGIRAIPTQIFYDKDGHEVLRHEGFMDKKSIVTVLERLGVKK